MRANATTIQINRLLSLLVRRGTAVDQGFAYHRPLIGGLREVTFPNSDDLPLTLLRRSYVEGYDATLRCRAYSALLDDGAVLQMSYLFHGKTIKRHRLAYFGSPRPVEPEDSQFSDDEDPYTHTDTQPTFFRFDFDDVLHVPEAAHPQSHLTIGHNKQCRIPVSSPVTPDRFLRFVFRHFFGKTDYQLPQIETSFPTSISDAECQELHVVVPRASAYAE